MAVDSLMKSLLREFGRLHFQLRRSFGMTGLGCILPRRSYVEPDAKVHILRMALRWHNFTVLNVSPIYVDKLRADAQMCKIKAGPVTLFF